MALLYCDGYLKFKEEKEQGKERDEREKAERFFNICDKVPLELKMILVKRIFLSPEIFFLSQQTDSALKRLLVKYQDESGAS